MAREGRPPARAGDPVAGAVDGPGRVRSGYPVVLDLAGRDVVVVGGGRVGTRRAAGLLEAGALVTVVTPEATAELAGLAGRGALTLRARAWLPSDLDDAVLVVAATGVPTVDRAVASAARERGALCNVAGEPALGDLTVPAVLRRGDLVLAVGTSGRAPGLAGAVRRRLERGFGPDWALLVAVLAELRPLLPPADAAEEWDALLDESGLAAALQSGDNDEAREQLERILTSRQAQP
jgi:precorrin-2 dehydrogenase/sirohydrochlorin ferrochelatase